MDYISSLNKLLEKKRKSNDYVDYSGKSKKQISTIKANKKIEGYNELLQSLNDISSGYNKVNDDYIKNYIKRTEDFYKNASTKPGYENVGIAQKDANDSRENILTQGREISNYLFRNRDNIDKAKYKELMDYIDSFEARSSEVTDYYKNAQDFYSQFPSKEAYDTYEKEKTYQEMSADQVDARLKELARERTAFEKENGGMFLNKLSRLGSYLVGSKGVGAGQNPGEEIRRNANSNLNRLSELQAEEEKLNSLKLKKDQEKYLKDLPEDTLTLLDKYNDAKWKEEGADVGAVISSMTGGGGNSSLYIEALEEQEKYYDELKNKGYSNEEIVNLAYLRKAQTDAEASQNIADDFKDMGAVGNFVMPIFLKGAGGVVGTYGNLKEKLNNAADGIDYGINPDSPWNALTKATIEMDEKNINSIDSPAGKFAYKAAIGIRDNLTRNLASGGVSGLDSAILLSQVLNEGIIEGKEKGYSDTKAITLGVLQSGIEAATNKWGLDFSKGASSGLKTIFRSFASEGFEELESNWLNNILDKIANEDNSEINKLYEQYISNGMSPDKALAEVAMKVVGDDVEAFLIGGLSGAGMSGAQVGAKTVYDNQRYKSIGNEVLKNDNLGELVSKAQELEFNDSKGAKKLKELANAVAGYSGVSANDSTGKQRRQIGRLTSTLYNQNIEKYISSSEDKTSAAVKAYVKKELTKQGVSNAERAAEVISKARTQTLNKSEQKIFDEYNGKELLGKAMSLKSDVIESLAADEAKKAKANVNSIERLVNETSNAQAIRERFKNTLSDAEGEVYVSADGKMTPIGNAYTVSDLKVGKNNNVTYKIKTNHGVFESDSENVNMGGDDTIIYAAALAGATDSIATEMVNTFHKMNHNLELNGKKAVSARDFSVKMQELLSFGKYGLDAYRERSNAVNGLSAEIVKEITDAGKAIKQKEIENSNKYVRGKKGGVDESRITNKNLSEKQKEGLNMARFISDFTGNKIVFFESYSKDGKLYYKDVNGNEAETKANGWYDLKSKEMWIDINCDNEAVNFTISHELVHMIKDRDVEAYHKLADFLVKTYYGKGKSVNDLVVQRQVKTEGMSFDVAFEEFVAESFSVMLGDEQVVTRLADMYKTDSKLFNTVLEILDSIIEKISKHIEKLKNGLYSDAQMKLHSAEAVNGLLFKNSVEGMRDVFVEALRTVSVTKNGNTVETQKNNTDTENEGVRYSLNKNFTESDLDRNIQKVSKMQPVANLSGKEFAKGETDLVTQVTKYFNSIGNIAHSKYGDIVLNRTGIKSSIGHGIGRNKAIAFKAVPETLSKGEVVDYQRNWKNRGYDTAIFVAPVIINGDKHYLAAVTILEKEKNSYYLHEVALEKTEDNAMFKTGTKINGTPSKALSSINILLQKLQNVNDNSMQNNKKYSLNVEYKNAVDNGDIQKAQQLVDKSAVQWGALTDDKGKPIKLYHGTTNQEEKSIWNEKTKTFDTEYKKFTVFKKQYDGHSGHFFNTDKDNAGGYGSTLYEVYLKMNKPLIISCNNANYSSISYNGQVKDTYEWAEYAHRNGYDGVIFYNISDGVGYGDLQNITDDYVVFNSAQIKSAEAVTYDDKGDVIPLEKRFSFYQDIRFSLKAEIESEYNKAVKSNDIEAAQKIVDEVAKKNGYNSPVLYHGTYSFGFTNFDLDKMDDKRSIFLTDNKNIASTYSGVTGTRNINIGKETENVNKLSADELVKKLNDYDAQYKSDTTEGAHHYELYDLQKTNKLIDTVNSGIEYLNNLVDKLIKDYADKMSADWKEEDAKVHKQLVKLSENLKAYRYEDLSTPIYLLLHHTDVFNGSKKIALLEKNIRLMEMLRYADTLNGIVVDEALDGYVIELMSIDEAKQHYINRLKQGNYSLYAKLGKSLVIDGKGALWKDIHHWTSSIEIQPTSVSVVKQDGYYRLVDNETKKIIPNAEMAFNSYTDKLYFSDKEGLRALIVGKANEIIHIQTESMNTTRKIAKFAQERGYDSVVFKNIRDNGGMNSEVDYDETADIYVIFDPASVKSADAITYDDNGNIIPLSERFNLDNKDIRFSLKDSDGEKLSEKQAEYFKYSKVRDKNGNLLVVYHGTADEFTIFDKSFIGSNFGQDELGFFFTDKESVAVDYADYTSYGTKRAKSGYVKQVYLNITNPLTIKIDYDSIGYWDENYKNILKRYKKGAYDGIIIKAQKYDSLYIVENSNQIKLTTNLNPTDSDDIRFSMREDSSLFQERDMSIYDVLGENKRQKSENKRLKQEISYLKELLKLQRKVTYGKIIDKKSAQAQARLLLRNTGSKMDLSELSDKLYDYYTYIITSKELAWDEVLENAGLIARDISRDIPQRAERGELATEVLSYLRKTRISFDGVQRAEIENTFDSYNNYRKKLMGSVIIANDGVPLDSVWQELAEMHPMLFSKETNSADMPSELYDIIMTLKDTKSLLDEYYETEHLRYLAEQIYDSYWNVSTLNSAADNYQREINHLKSEHATRVSEIKKKHEKDMADIKTYYHEMINRIRRQKNASFKKQMLDYKYQVAESHLKDLERRHNTQRRREIIKISEGVERKLIKPTKEKNISIEMQPLACDFLLAFNWDTVDADFRLERLSSEMEKTTDPQRLNELENRYNNIKAQGEKKADDLKKKRDNILRIRNEAKRKLNDAQKVQKYDAVVEKAIEAVEDLIGTTPIRRLNTYQMDCLYQTARMVEGYIRRDKELFIEGKKLTTEAAANSVMRELDRLSKKNHSIIKKLEPAENSFWSFLKPDTAFDVIGSDTLKELFLEARKGDDKFARNIEEAQSFLAENVKKFGSDKWDMDEKAEFTAQGEKVTIPLGERMSLYAWSKRGQAIPHLEGGGFCQVEPVKKKLLGKINVEYTANEKNAHRVSEAELGAIINSLTDEQKAFVDATQKYLSEVMGAKGNEVSRELYQIDLFNEKYYFPLKVSTVYNYFQELKNSGEARIKNAGFSKPVVEKANDPIVLESYENVWANHVVQMSKYNAYVLGIENLTKVFAYKGLDKSSVQAFLEGVHGEAATKYVKNFLTDLNGGRKGGSANDLINVGTKLISTFKKVTVSASLSTAIQQPSAIIRAMSYINPKYFAQIPHKENWEELKKYAPIAALKEIGGFDMSTGVNVAEYLKQKEYEGFKDKAKALFKDSKYRDDVLMWAASKGDEIAWSVLWNAVKKEQTEKYPSLSKEKLLEVSGKRFTEIATKTQVYDSVFTRSDIMRSPNEINKMATAFMGEPMTNLNILIGSFVQMRRGKMSKHQAAANIACIFVAQAVAAASASLIYAMRDDDDDETFLEKYMNALGKKTFDELLLGPINWIPYVRDIVSMIQGFKVTRTDMSAFSDLIKSFEDMSNDKIPWYDKIFGLAGSFGAFFGIPLKNITREVKGIINTYKCIVDDNLPEDDDAPKAFVEGVFGEKNMQDVNEYLKKGKTEKAKVLLDDLFDEKVKANVKKGQNREDAEKKAKSSIKSALTSYWKPRYIEAHNENDSEKMDEIRKILNSTKMYDDVDEKLQDWIKE